MYAQENSDTHTNKISPECVRVNPVSLHRGVQTPLPKQSAWTKYKAEEHETSDKTKSSTAITTVNLCANTAWPWAVDKHASLRKRQQVLSCPCETFSWINSYTETGLVLICCRASSSIPQPFPQLAVSWALPSYQPSHTKNVSQCRKGTGRRHNYSFSSVRPWQSTWLVSLSPLNAQFGTKLHALYIYAEVLDVTTTRMSACRKATGAHKERKQAIQQHSTAEPGNKTNLLGSTSSQNKTPAQTGPKFKVKPFQKYKKGEKSEERKKRGNQRNRQSGE